MAATGGASSGGGIGGAAAQAAPWLMVIGAVSGAVSTYQGAQARKSSMRYEAEMADLNAKLAERTAESVLAQGQREEQRSQLQTAQLKSTQRVGMAANGIDLGEGSAAQVLTSTDVMGEIDANTIHANAVRAAWGYRQQASNFSNSAAMGRSAASAVSPGASAATSLVGSATQVAGSWYRMNQVGALGNGTSNAAQLSAANQSDDPLGAFGESKGWY